MAEGRVVTISVVIPVYGCVGVLTQLVVKLESALSDLVPTFEIILVEDGFSSESWEEVKKMAKEFLFVKGIRLSRNFGQHEAITAGLEECKGEWVVVMDCDLQDDPSEIKWLYKKAQEEYDIVFARRKQRQDRWFKRTGSRLFYRLLGYLSDTKIDASVANFGIYRKKVINAVLDMKENLRYFPVMVRWVGYNSTYIEVAHGKRNQGRSTYSWKKLTQLALGVMISFSDKPLRIIVKVGFVISLLSAFYAIFLIWHALVVDVPVAGWTSVMVSLWFIGGLLMMMLGVVGVYVGKAFDETKHRPLYIVSERVSSDYKDA